MHMPIYYTTAASCRPNNAIVIGGVNTAAKRRIQRKALHSCRREMPTPAPDPDCKSDCCKPVCNKSWPDCKVCCEPFLKTVEQCNGCTKEAMNTNKCTIPLISLTYHNCLTKERWSAEKQTWCCNNNNLGCRNNAS
jgi:hypothetical protein